MWGDCYTFFSFSPLNEQLNSLFLEVNVLLVVIHFNLSARGVVIYAIALILLRSFGGGRNWDGFIRTDDSRDDK